MLRAISPFFLVIAVLILSTDRRIIRALRANQATSPEAGILLPARNAIWRWRLRRLLRRGAVAQVEGSDRMYLDETKWQAFRAWRRRRALIILAIVIPLTLLITYFSSSASWFSSDV